jgi:hypothetical protein
MGREPAKSGAGRSGAAALRAAAWPPRAAVAGVSAAVLAAAGLAAVCLAMAGASPARAVELPNPRLSTIWPPGAPVGTTVEATIDGDDLDEVTELVCSDPRIIAEPILDSRPFAEKPEPFTRRFRVTVPPDAAPGHREVRACGRFGLSTPRSFAIDDRPQVDEPAGNHVPEKAARLSLDTVVNGRTDVEAVDHYVVDLAAGDRVTVILAARRIDSRLVGIVEVRDPDGKQIAFDRATHTHEPAAAFTAQAAGPHAIRVRDALYRGGATHAYRLVATRRPHVEFVWPPVAAAGRERRHRLFGHHLPGGGPAAAAGDPAAVDLAGYEAVETTIVAPATGASRGASAASHRREPSEVEVEGFDYRLASPHGPAAPVFIPLTRLPIVEEREPNESAAAAQAIEPPCEVVGRFYGDRDDDWFSFTAAKGSQWWVEVVSERLALPTDPSLWIGRPGESGAAAPIETVAQDEPAGRFRNQPFDSPTHDPALSFTAAADGAQLVRVRDLYAGSLAHPRHVYRLVVRLAAPDFQLVATCKALVEMPAQRDFPATPLLRRGGTQPLVVQCYRRGGSSGPVTLSCAGLPPGVTAAPVDLAADEHQATIVLVAAADAPAWQGPIRVVGRSGTGEAAIEREALASTTVWNKNNRTDFVEARLLPDLRLAVIEEQAPVLARVGGDGPWQAAPGTTLSIPVVVEGRVELKGSGAVEVRGLPSTYGTSPQAPRVVLDKPAAKDRFEGAVELKIPAKMPPGRYPAHLVTQVRVGYPRNPEAAARAAARRDAFAATLARLRGDLGAAERERDEAARKVADLAARAGDAAAAAEPAADSAALKTAAAVATERAQAAAAVVRKAEEEQKALEKLASDLAEGAKPKDVEAFVSSASFVVEVVTPPEKKP